MNKLFKIEVMEGYGPFNGYGGYATCRATVLCNSVKRGMAKAKKILANQDAGGMVPILYSLKITNPYGKVMCNVRD